MLETIAVIGDPDTATGFRLAGIERVYEVSEEEDVSEIFSELEKEGVSIIIVTERIAEKNREKIKEINVRKKGVAPIIVEIPDKRGPIERVDMISELTKRAVGIVIK
ncbi:MAG: Archaeal/vacuolar-type H+-ATPase subunit F/Vma7 [Candidatus Alkanophagales archaeon MCA70_species_1]|nr:Archaeal/vacuolar-type H+-ATPase subunit F/Vma7 [Candidatus Alkanophaga volatiphilum]